MSRSFHTIDCESDRLAATLDWGTAATGLLIVSGGNEIRSGAHGGMARLAGTIADHGFPVLRYDRRGIGESTGRNSGFLGSAADIAAAARFFRQEQKQVTKIIAFGNCDAATALALFGPDAQVDGYILANPWVIETDSEATADAPTLSAAAIRSRYRDRLRNPRTLIDLLTGKIDLRKLLTGLRRAARSEGTSALALRLGDALSSHRDDCPILLAKRDTTARAFLAAWTSPAFATVRSQSAVSIDSLDSASHSFADEEARNWFTEKILARLRAA